MLVVYVLIQHFGHIMVVLTVPIRNAMIIVEETVPVFTGQLDVTAPAVVRLGLNKYTASLERQGTLVTFNSHYIVGKTLIVKL